MIGGGEEKRTNNVKVVGILMLPKKIKKKLKEVIDVIDVTKCTARK